ncbi:MAG: GNAT family N-acetyltransferase [Acidobacteriota bacterium]
MQTIRLSEVSIEGLSEIFEQEIRCWKKELFWDYRPAVELIKRYVSSKSLPGYALINECGAILGYSYYIVDQPVAYIGNMFVRMERASPEVCAHLFRRTLLALKAKSRVTRIECQTFAFNFNFAPLFEHEGFQILDRHFLTLSLDQIDGDLGSPAGLNIIPWDRAYLTRAAQAIYDSYRGSPDYELCRDYQSSEGCMRFLLNLVDNPGCGSFSKETSYLALDAGGNVCAVLISSRIAPDTGMIPQISVRKKFQGQGIGSLLLKTYFQECRRRGFRRVTLSVTGQNQQAYRLYLRLGFRKTKDFHAYIWARQ